jgi:hypothetical protein
MVLEIPAQTHVGCHIKYPVFFSDFYQFKWASKVPSKSTVPNCIWISADLKSSFADRHREMAKLQEKNIL